MLRFASSRVRLQSQHENKWSYADLDVKFPHGCKVDVTSLSQLKEELMTSEATKTLSKTLSLSLQTTLCNLITASQKTWNVSLERK